MDDVFVSPPDYELGKIVKYFKPNPTGENMYLADDKVTIIKDEDKIKAVQRIFKHNYYKPGGKGAQKVLGHYSNRTRATNLPPAQDRYTSSSCPDGGR